MWIKRALMKIKRETGTDASLVWCKKPRLPPWRQLNCFSPDAVDSNYPWLITDWERCDHFNQA